jgi:hypothetical protein
MNCTNGKCRGEVLYRVIKHYKQAEVFDVLKRAGGITGMPTHMMLF